MTIFKQHLTFFSSEEKDKQTYLNAKLISPKFFLEQSIKQATPGQAGLGEFGQLERLQNENEDKTKTHD